MRFLLFPVFFICVVLFSCKSKNRQAADEIFEKIQDTKNMNAGNKNYAVDIPDGWTTESRIYAGIDYFFLKAPKTETDPNTNINIISEFMQNLDAETYRGGTIQSLIKAVPSVKIMDTGSIESINAQGLWFSYTMSPKGIDAFLVCYIYPKNGIAYILTTGTLPKDSLHYRETFDKVARSFEFTEE